MRHVLTRLTRITWQFVVYFCRHRGKLAGKDDGASTRILRQNPHAKIPSKTICHTKSVGVGVGCLLETPLAVPGPLVEDRAESLLVKTHPESELVRKLCDLYLAVFLLKRPEPLQFFLVNGAVFPFAGLQLAFDVGGKRCRANADLAQVAIGLSRPLKII